jgi:hypothetical protein
MEVSQFLSEPPMQPLIHFPQRAIHFIVQPTAPILAGLSVLALVLTFPGMPPCTGMALVALGATSSTTNRLNQSTARGPLLLAHLMVYTAIYLLFVGATLDAAERSGIPLSGLAKLDLAASFAVVTIAARNAIRAILVPLKTEY